MSWHIKIGGNYYAEPERVPPVCTAQWDEQDWCRWSQMQLDKQKAINDALLNHPAYQDAIRYAHELADRERKVIYLFFNRNADAIAVVPEFDERLYMKPGFVFAKVEPKRKEDESDQRPIQERMFEPYDPKE